MWCGTQGGHKSEGFWVVGCFLRCGEENSSSSSSLNIYVSLGNSDEKFDDTGCDAKAQDINLGAFVYFCGGGVDVYAWDSVCA